MSPQSQRLCIISLTLIAVLFVGIMLIGPRKHAGDTSTMLMRVALLGAVLSFALGLAVADLTRQ